MVLPSKVWENLKKKKASHGQKNYEEFVLNRRLMIRSCQGLGGIS